MERVGGPSRWNTLRALRVLDWWDKGAASAPDPLRGPKGQKVHRHRQSQIES
jgi:hypothetical protein